MAFGGSLAQSSVVPSWSIAGITPDLPLILTALIALRRGPETGCLVGFASGLFQDVASGGLLGVQALSRALVGFGVGFLPGKLTVNHPAVQIPGLVILPQALYNGFVGAACILALEAAQTLRRRQTWI